MPIPTLTSFLRDRVGLSSGDHVVIAYSGGADSTALLRAVAHIAPQAGYHLTAAHVDHGLDPGSAARSRRAHLLATQIGVDFIAHTLIGKPVRESPEAWARRHRYRFLESLVAGTDGRIVTAHHADDQAETVILRMLFGSGIAGLSAILPIRGSIVRPWLTLPGREVRALLHGTGLKPISDPTNLDHRIRRNAVRSHILPALARRQGEHEDLVQHLTRLAEAARRANNVISLSLTSYLRIAGDPEARNAQLDRARYEALPATLKAAALGALAKRAGREYPLSAAVRHEVDRQLGSSQMGCDCGNGWRLEGTASSLLLRLHEPDTPDFTYTLTVPGALDIRELSVRFELRRGRVSQWMFRGVPDRAGLATPLREGDTVVVRNRRAGDRIMPLGSSHHRRLKAILIDHHVPRHLRKRIPLLIIDNKLAWVPGITIDNRLRLRGDQPVWIASVHATR